jgi:hypothetical protein
MNEPFQMAARYYSPTYWWIATELIRRNPQLELVETFPLDGFYDCLTVYGETNGTPIHIDLNRYGSIHVHPGHIGLISGSEVIAHASAHWAVKQIERVAGLNPSDTAPASSVRIITLRILARVLNYLVNDRSQWAIRSMTPDGSYSSVPFMPESLPPGAKTPLPELFATGQLYSSFLHESGLKEILTGELYKNFVEGRFWALQRDEVVVALFDTKGVVYTKHSRVALKPLYSRLNRNLTQTMAVCLADVLP